MLQINIYRLNFLYVSTYEIFNDFNSRLFHCFEIDQRSNF